MTPQSQKTEQKRLHSCVLAQHKSGKIPQKHGQRSRATLKISDFVAETVGRVEITRENSQIRYNRNLLGKYPLIIPS